MKIRENVSKNIFDLDNDFDNDFSLRIRVHRYVFEATGRQPHLVCHDIVWSYHLIILSFYQSIIATRSPSPARRISNFLTRRSQDLSHNTGLQWLGQSLTEYTSKTAVVWIKKIPKLPLLQENDPSNPSFGLFTREWETRYKNNRLSFYVQQTIHFAPKVLKPLLINTQ